MPFSGYSRHTLSVTSYVMAKGKSAKRKSASPRHTPSPVARKRSSDRGNTSPVSKRKHATEHTPPASQVQTPPSETRSRSSSTSSATSLASNSPTPNIKIPPIFIAGSDWHKVAAKLMSTIPVGSLQAHIDSKVKILCRDEELFRIVQKYFRLCKTDFFTHPLQNERSLKIVIKGLLTDTPESEVAEGLKDLGYDVTHVRQFSNSTRKFPIFMVTLPSNPTVTNAFSRKPRSYSCPLNSRLTNLTLPQNAFPANVSNTPAVTVVSPRIV